MVKFTLPGDLIKAIAKLYSEIGTSVSLKFDGTATFIVIDPSKTVLAITEAETLMVLEEGEASITFDTETFRRIASTLKREEVIFEIREDKLILTASGDIEKKFEIPATVSEPPKLSREALMKRFGDKITCRVTITSEFLRVAIDTIKKVLKPDTLEIKTRAGEIVFTSPAALTKAEIKGIDGSANVQEISCDEEVELFFPFEPIEAFAKNIKGAVVELLLGHNMPLILDAELAAGSNVIMVVSPRVL